MLPINFEAQLAAAVLTQQVANQSRGTLRAGANPSLFSLLSDDPDTPQVGDPTITPVSGLPVHLYLATIARQARP